MAPYLKKDVNHLDSVQKRYTQIIFNRCNIPNTSYTDRLIKLKIKSLEYKRLEFDLITFFKLLNGENTIEMNNIFKSYEKNYLLRGNNKKITSRYHFNNDAWLNSFFTVPLICGINYQMN